MTFFHVGMDWTFTPIPFMEGVNSVYRTTTPEELARRAACIFQADGK